MLNPIGRGIGLMNSLGLKPEHISAIFESISRCKQAYPGKTVVAMPPAMVPPQYLHMAFKDRDVRISSTCQFPLLGVLPNGDITICALSRDNQELHFGNVRDRRRRLRDVWEEARLSELRSQYVAAESLRGICADCVWKYACKGACRAWAYQEGADFDAPFPICKALDEAGAFPKAYRLSEQNAALERYKQMQVGCSCSHASI
jgi:radical SAM protein with 4Fe4S-binding SPASM domain